MKEMKKKKNIEQFFKEKFKNFEVTAPKNSWNRILRKFIKENKSDDNQDIERVFQEKFKDFEAMPPENSWTEIQRKLNKKNNSKNIERIFQEKFKDFESTPPENSWIEIQNRLKQKKNKKKTVIPLWARYSGIAALLLIGFFVFRNNFDNPTIENSEIVDNLNENKSNIDNNHNTETNNQKDDFNNSVVDNSNAKNNNHNTETNNQKDDFNNSVVDNSNSKNNNHNTETNNQKDDFNNSVVDNSDEKNEKTDDKNANKKDLLEEIKFAQQEDEQPILLTPNAFNKWRITPSAGAVTMNSLSKGSPISDKLTDNSKDYQTSMSYGLGLDYSLNKKLSIRTGINKLSTAYNTNDVLVYVSADRIEVLENAINVDPTTNKDVVVTAKRPLSTGGDSKTEGYINQKMGYIEIPVELSYKLLSSKFGIEIIGGISTLLLQENEVSVFSNNMKTTLGKANNLSDTHFSTNIGVGFRYEIFKSFDINLDPMFKYQLGAFEKNNGNFKPYLFGIYTGLSFKF